jgi:AraC family transcriptional regulator
MYNIRKCKYYPIKIQELIPLFKQVISMKHLKSGQHFGASRSSVRLQDCILTEAGYTPHIEVPWHYHENAYFFYHLRGRLDEVNRKKSITCTAGTLLFHHWQDAHYDKNFSKDAAFFHIEVGNKWFLRHQLKPDILEGSLSLTDPQLKPIFQRIHREIAINDGTTQISVDGLLLQSIAMITRTKENGSPRIPAWVSIVRDAIHDTLPEKITLEMLATLTGLHPVHLSKEFPKYFQAGFGQYIRNLRIQKAIELLSDKNMTLSEIACACGFSDQSHFIKIFKSSIGTNPLKYRKELGAR